MPISKANVAGSILDRIFGFKSMSEKINKEFKIENLKENQLEELIESTEGMVLPRTAFLPAIKVGSQIEQKKDKNGNVKVKKDSHKADVGDVRNKEADVLKEIKEFKLGKTRGR